MSVIPGCAARRRPLRGCVGEVDPGSDAAASPRIRARVSGAARPGTLEPTPIPTISCINIRPVPQALGRRGPIWYPAKRRFRSPHVTDRTRLTGCGGGDISPMSPSSSSAKTASAPNSFFTATLEQADPDIAAAIRGELGRQRHEIELIASENIVSRAVLEAQGSVMTNKYAEGYPGESLLRRLRMGRRRRDAGDRARQEAVRRAASPMCSRIPAAR